MKPRHSALCRAAYLLTASISIAACSAGDPNEGPQEVEEFAARIGNNGGNGAPKPSAPKLAPANATDRAPTAKPEADISPVCGSPKVAPFFGRKADNITREAVLAAVAPNGDVRFIDAGSDVIPVPSSSRLNVKVDAMGVIRSATCG
ncbi:MAG: hypothetical protein ABJ242_10380 [Marinomonas sp.]